MIQTAFLGDVILLTGLLRVVRRAFPNAELGVVVIPACAEVVEGWADRVWVIDKQGSDSKTAWMSLQRQITESGYSVALLPHRSLRTARFAYDCDIPLRIGFDRGLGSVFHSIRVQYPSWEYEGRRNLALLSPIAKTEDIGLPQIHIPESAIQRVVSLMNDQGLERKRFVVVAPGAVWATKRWPVDSYCQLSQMLQDDYGLKTVSVGGPQDLDICQKVVGDPGHCFAGKLSPVESAALMQQASLVISGDTAPTHLATSVGARQIVIFGSTAPRLGFMPPSDNARAAGMDIWCRPCTNHGRKRCPRGGDPICLMKITPQAVLDAAKDWLNEDMRIDV